MKHEPRHDNLDVSPSGEYRVDQCSTDFEKAWKSGKRERIEDWLPRVPLPEQSRLLHELIIVEVELRRAAGESPQAEEYEQHFRDQAEIVNAAFAVLARHLEERSLAATVIGSAGQDTSGGDFSVAAVEHDAEPLPEAIGRYPVLGKLGKGAFGIVYLACDPRLDRKVAIKVAKSSQFASVAGRQRFLNEARGAARLDHPGIVRVYEVDECGDLLYIVQQYIEGANLEDCVKAERWSRERIVSLMSEVAQALAFAHRQGLAHCDLKPANILVDREGHSHLVDFGLSVNEDTQRGRKGEVSGSPRYMSPEQTRGKMHHLDGRTDIWSLGVILYELVTGRQPFSGANRDELFDEIRDRDPKPPRMIDGQISAELERIILWCLGKRASDRYSTASEVARDLQKLGHRPQRRWWWAAAAAAMLLIIPLGIFWRPLAPTGSTSPNVGIGPPLTTLPRPAGLIESFRVVHFREHPEHLERLGDIGVETHAARNDDLVRVVARFHEPVYCYLIAFNTNGKEQLCHPADEQTEPQRLATLEYPDPASKLYFVLDDGTGQQAFAVVASREPLPAFGKWRQESGPAPWQHFDAEGVITFDRQDVRVTAQGSQREVRASIAKARVTEPVEQLQQFLSKRSESDAIQAVAFPVLAKPPLQKDVRIHPD